MNFPHVAFNTFLQKKNEDSFKSIMKTVVKRLRKIANPTKRAKYIHRKIDEAISRVFENPVSKKFVSCRKGCTGCCYTQVSVSQDEAYLLAKRIREGAPVDFSRLTIQSEAENSADKWYNFSYAKRRCIFLDEKNECMVYEDRPAVCRTNYVLSDPKDCDTSDGKTKPVRILNTPEADVLIIAGYSVSSSNGVLPTMIMKTLYRLREQDLISNPNGS